MKRYIVRRRRVVSQFENIHIDSIIIYVLKGEGAIIMNSSYPNKKKTFKMIYLTIGGHFPGQAETCGPEREGRGR